MKRIPTILAIASIIGLTSNSAAVPVMTRFEPNVHGFKFSNRFTNDFIPGVDWRTDGLCSGMVWAAMDYFRANRQIPQQWWRPATGDPLEKYIYDRQVACTVATADQWLELAINVDGARDAEFFNWGLDNKPGGRLAALRASIDAGNPIPIGLKSHGGGADHKVLVIGYDMGRYQGDLGAFKEDFKLFVYDPNHPNVVTTLVPDSSRKVFVHADRNEPNGDPNMWRTYSVDQKWSQRQPIQPVNLNFLNNGRVFGVLVTFATGADDLRGGNDNVNVVLNNEDGTRTTFNNVNKGARWVVNYDQTVFLPLLSVPRTRIRSIDISTTSRGDGADNWTVDNFSIAQIGKNSDGSFFEEILGRRGNFRFTGQNSTINIKSVVSEPAQSVTQLDLSITTGSDDLRGGNDNVNATITFRDRTTQTFTNINNRESWASGTTKTATLKLNSARALDDIRSLTLTTTSGGGDNWNVAGVVVRAIGNGLEQEIGFAGQMRFTGDNRTFPVHLVNAQFAGRVTFINLFITTGNDDLRGGSDNLNITVRLRNGRRLTFENVNNGLKWDDNSNNSLMLRFTAAVNPGDIASVELNFPSSGDNWVMQRVVAVALGNGVREEIGRGGPFKFEGNRRSFTVNREQ